MRRVSIVPHSRARMDKEDIRYAFERAKNRCESCYSPKNLTIHHLVTRGRGGSWEYLHHPVNLSVLCRDCHDEVHRGRDDYYKFWLFEEPPDECPKCDESCDWIPSKRSRTFECPCGFKFRGRVIREKSKQTRL